MKSALLLSLLLLLGAPALAQNSLEGALDKISPDSNLPTVAPNAGGGAFAVQNYPSASQQSFGMMPQARPRPNLFQLMMGGPPAQQAPPKPPENPFSMRSIMRSFFDGGGSNTPGKAGDAQALGNAQSNLQTALDQASQAEDAAGRASYGDRGSRMNAAEEAQNHANAARAAADRATSAAAGHQLAANDAASQARDAANRAQAAADRARYNASQATN